MFVTYLCLLHVASPLRWVGLRTASAPCSPLHSRLRCPAGLRLGAQPAILWVRSAGRLGCSECNACWSPAWEECCWQWVSGTLHGLYARPHGNTRQALCATKPNRIYHYVCYDTLRTPHNTTLHCNALHYTALYYTDHNTLNHTLHTHFTDYTTPDCTALHCTALHYTTLYHTALQCTALHYTIQYWP